MKYLDLITETPQAVKGDWSDGDHHLGTFTADKYFRKYKVLTQINDNIILYQKRNSLRFELIEHFEQDFAVKNGTERKRMAKATMILDLVRVKDLERKLGYKKLIKPDGITIDEDYQSSGLASFVYNYLVNQLRYAILGDELQYFGARRLWASLSKVVDLNVDVVDLEKNKIIKRDVQLHHGRYDSDFDKSIWSYEPSERNHIRPILTQLTNAL